MSDIERTVVASTGIVNGLPVAMGDMSVSILDRSVRFGLGLFETVRIRGGHALLLGLHTRRMSGGMERLGLHAPFDSRTLARWAGAAISCGQVDNGVLRMIVSSGENDAARPAFFAWASEGTPYTEDIHERGVTATVGLPRSDPHSPIGGTKALSYAALYLARRDARRSGFDEGLVRGQGESLVEGTSSNLFIVKGSNLLTPPVTEGILPGVTRAVVLALARGLSLDPLEEPITLKRLVACDEAFLTSALLGVAGLVRVDGVVIGNGLPGPITKRIERSYLRLATPRRDSNV